MLRWLTATCLLLVLSGAHCAELRGRVVSVPDGDSIVVLDAKHRQHRVRLAGIDAPEKGQRFSNRSRDHLASLVHRQDVIVQWRKRDDYDRLVGIVFINDRDINLEQVRAGLAWWYRVYAPEQTYEARRMYELAERQAQQDQRGLWADRKPVPPWAWRRGNERAR